MRWPGLGAIFLLVLTLAVPGLLTAPPARAKPSYGLSAFGDLKYPADFQHFDYVDPDAPKGGTLRLWSLATFDSLNPFALKGTPADGLADDGPGGPGSAFVYAALMEASADEPDALYGLVASSADLSPDRATLTFRLRPQARFDDGHPIRSADVVASFHALVAQGDPRYRLLYAGVASVAAVDDLDVTFHFRADAPRDEPLLVARMPILPRIWLATHRLDAASLTPIPGSGPYRIAAIDPGRSITYERVKDYWAKDLPVMRGRHNFDRIRYDYYRDRDVALEAFLAGAYDFRDEPTSKSWATGYRTADVARGRIVREVVPDHTPSGVQAFFLNTRRRKFQDRRVREAMGLAFDFEWLNRELFYGLYKRTRSMFENSAFAATGMPTAAELALLDPYRGRVPAQVFGPAFVPPTSDGSGEDRANLLEAQALLAAAGYGIRAGRCVDLATGEPLSVEFLIFEPVFERVIAPYARNLRRLGIMATTRLLDVASYQNRVDRFDYDIIVRRLVQPMTPGIEQRSYWGTTAARQTGSLNFSGIENPTVDALIDDIAEARSRPALTIAAHALDRVLMWNYYTVPQFYSGTVKIAYWNRFGRPPIAPRYALGVIDTWWLDPARAALIKAGKAPPRPPPQRQR